MDTRLELTGEMRDKMTAVVNRRIRDAVDGATERDEQLLRYAELLEGLPVSGTGTSTLWEGAAEIQDPITLEHFISLLAAILASMRQPPFWLVEAVEPGNEQAAMDIEDWLTVKAHECYFPKALYDIVYCALRDYYSVLYVGWKQELGKSREEMWKGEGGEVVATDQRDPDAQYERVGYVQDTVKYDGPELRVVDVTDFYVYPPNAQDVDKALGCGERQYWSREQLLRGIAEHGFDEQEVMDLITKPPTHYLSGSEWREHADERSGTKPTGNSADDYYEIFWWHGSMPLLQATDGKIETPEDYWNEDFLWVSCPGRECTLLIDYAENQDFRPYVVFRMFPTPNRLHGNCLPKMLQPYQEEANANIQFVMNMANLVMSPVLTAPLAWLKEFGKYKIFPGAILPRKSNNPNEVQPLEWDKSGVPMGLELQQMIEGRARELVSGHAYGQLPTKVRKATEIDAAMQGVDTKFQLFKENLMEPLERVAVMLIALHLQHMNGEGETVVGGAGRSSVTVTPEQLRQRYRYIPHSNTDGSDPQARVQKVQMMLEALRTSPIYQMALQQGDLTLEYHAMSRLYEVMGERNIQAWLGPQPPTPEEMAQMQQQMMAQQGMIGPGGPGVPPTVPPPAGMAGGPMGPAPGPAGGVNGVQGVMVDPSMLPQLQGEMNPMMNGAGVPA